MTSATNFIVCERREGETALETSELLYDEVAIKSKHHQELYYVAAENRLQLKSPGT
jgi:hypothetical protein